MPSQTTERGKRNFKLELLAAQHEYTVSPIAPNALALAQAYINNQEPKPAIAVLEKWSGSDFTDALAQSSYYAKMGWALKDIGQYDRALSSLMQATDLLQNIPSSDNKLRQLAQNYHFAGLAHHHLGYYAQAANSQLISLDLSMQLQDHSSIAFSLLWLADAAVKSKDRTLARQRLTKAKQTISQLAKGGDDVSGLLIHLLKHELTYSHTTGRWHELALNGPLAALQVIGLYGIGFLVRNLFNRRDPQI